MNVPLASVGAVSKAVIKAVNKVANKVAVKNFANKAAVIANTKPVVIESLTKMAQCPSLVPVCKSAVKVSGILLQERHSSFKLVVYSKWCSTY